MDYIGAMNYKKYFTSPEFLDITKTYSDTTRKLVNKEANTIYSERQQLVLTAVMNCDETTVAEVLTCYHRCSPEMEPDEANYSDLIGIIRGLHEYPQYKDMRLDTLINREAVKNDPSLQEDFNKTSALINITSMLYKEYKNPPLNAHNTDDPSTSKIWLTPHLADLAFKHHELILDFIGHYAQGGHEIAYGITYLDWFKQQDINNVTDQTIETLYNYYRVTNAIIQHTKWENIKEDTPKALWINNPELEDFIENHPEHIDDLLPYIEDRRTTNIDGFYEYKGNNTALKAGTL